MWYQTNVIQSSYVKSARMQFITIAEAILLPTAKAFPLFQPWKHQVPPPILNCVKISLLKDEAISGFNIFYEGLGGKNPLHITFPTFLWIILGIALHDSYGNIAFGSFPEICTNTRLFS